MFNDYGYLINQILIKSQCFSRGDSGYSFNQRSTNPRVTSGGLCLVPGGPTTPERQFIAILGRVGVFIVFFFWFFVYFYT